MSIVSASFRADLFKEPTNYEEWQLCDRKRELPDLSRDPTRVEFVKDVIALANSARMLGRPGRLLFGLDDRGGICGIDSILDTCRRDFTADINIWEDIRKKIKDILSEYVAPILNWDFQHGTVDEHNVAYLLVEPVATRQPFQVHRRYKSGQTVLLTPGECWVRSGESKLKLDKRLITPDESPYCYSHAEVPYVLPSVWEAYFEMVLSDKQIQRDRTLSGYQELAAVDGRPLSEGIQGFLDGDHRLLVISGAANSGKSVFLRRLVARLVEEAISAVKQIREREEFAAPSLPIPVYLPLQGLEISDLRQLIDRLLDSMNHTGSFWSIRPKCPERLLEHSDLNWMICMDGLDEIWSRPQQRRFLSALRHFIDRFEHTKVILTTRPFEWQPDWELWQATSLTVAQFSEEQVKRYMSNYLDGPEFDNAVGALKADPELWQLCSSPGYLEAALNELVAEPIVIEQVESSLTGSADTEKQSLPEIGTEEDSIQVPKPIQADDLLNTEGGGALSDETRLPSEQQPEEWKKEPSPPVRAGIILDRAYRALWEREKKRRYTQVTSFDQWWLNTGKLAIETDGHKPRFLQKMVSRSLGSTGLYWLQSLGVICRFGDDSVFGFTTELTKAYFAATYLAQLLQVGEQERAQRLANLTLEKFRAKMDSILAVISSASEQLMQG